MKKIIFLVIFISIATTSAYADQSSKAAVTQCLALHNSVLKKYEVLTPAEKLTFVHEFLRAYSGEKSAEEFMKKKTEFLENMDASDSYAKLLITQWTESCIEKTSQANKGS